MVVTSDIYSINFFLSIICLSVLLLSGCSFRSCATIKGWCLKLENRTTFSYIPLRSAATAPLVYFQLPALFSLPSIFSMRTQRLEVFDLACYITNSVYRSSPSGKFLSNQIGALIAKAKCATHCSRPAPNRMWDGKISISRVLARSLDERCLAPYKAGVWRIDFISSWSSRWAMYAVVEFTDRPKNLA